MKNAAGTRFMVTAGHCYANGTSVRTESNARVVGTVQSRALASLGSGPVDMELLAGQSYWGRIFTGGIVSTTSAPVVSAGGASVGYTAYCHSGRTTVLAGNSTTGYIEPWSQVASRYGVSIVTG